MILSSGTPLVDGRPWGFGAAMVKRQPKGGTCPRCSTLYKRGGWMHAYSDGDLACTACAEAWCSETFSPSPVPAPMGQRKLF